MSRNIIIICILFALTSCSNLPDYSVLSEDSDSIFNNKARIEILLTKKEPKLELEKIARFYVEKYNDKKHVFLTFYLSKDAREVYAYTNSENEILNKIVIAQPIYGDIGWFTAKLKQMKDYKIVGKYMDTLLVPIASAVLEKEGKYTFVNGYLTERKISVREEYDVKILDNDMISIKLKNSEQGESYLVIKDTMHLISGIDGRFVMKFPRFE